MDIKCLYCDSLFDAESEVCPHCGAENPSFTGKRMQPKTIGELKDWYSARKLPPYEVTRFFIGKNCREPKAFGIYEHDGVYTVYKNKADGSRSVRYEGTDEAFAVNELLERLKQEIRHQKSGNKTGQEDEKKEARRNLLTDLLTLVAIGGSAVLYDVCTQTKSLLMLLIFAVLPFAVSFVAKKINLLTGTRIGGYVKKFYLPYLLVLLLSFGLIFGPKLIPRYYRFDSRTFCRYADRLFEYDPGSRDYFEVDIGSETYSVMLDDPEYRVDVPSDSEYSFRDSYCYDSNFAIESDSDSDYDWDSGDSWDSGSTDWDSDW